MEDNKEKGLREQTVSGVLWSFFERMLAQGVSFVVSIILARILLPEEYGLIAIVLVIINICNVFFNTGFSTALIQKKEADELDFSTAFWGSMFLAVILYGLVWGGANFVARFYHQDLLCHVIRIMGLSLLVSALKSIQKAYVSRKMQFRKFFLATLGGTVAASIAGIWMAIAGYGVWALATQYLINAVIDTVVLSLSIEWRPKWLFSFRRFKQLLSFGWKVLGASLIYTVYEDLRTLIIGKVYSSNDLAYYNKGKQLPGFIVNNINSAVSSAFLPAMSKLQNDTTKMKSAMKSFIRLGAFIMMPMMIGLAVVAKPLVILLLTEKWLFCVPYLRLMCFYYVLMPIQEANTQAVLALGRSDISLKAEILKRGVNLVIIALTFWVSVEMLAVGEIVSMIFAMIVNTVITGKLVGFGLKEQIQDIIPYFVCSLFMGIIVVLVARIFNSELLSLCVQILVGIMSYLLFLRIIHDDNLTTVKKMVQLLLNRNR